MSNGPTTGPVNGAPRLRPREIVRNLAWVVVKPRPAVRRLLESHDERVGMALVVLATFAHLLFDDKFRDLEQTVRATPPALGALLTLVWFGGAGLITVALFFAFAFGVTWVGRLFGGIATTRETRLALAWGTAPLVWSLLWAIPARLYFISVGAPDSLRDVILGSRDPGAFLTKKTLAVVMVALVVALLKVVVITWTTVVTSQCLGEVNRFSSWRGLGTFLVSILIPGILIFVTFAAIIGAAAAF